jgi:hypothetical protein
MSMRLLLVGVLLVTAVPAKAGERLTIRVSPAMSFAPANLVVQATIEAHKDNRSIEVIAESSDFYRRSEVTLEGLHAPRVSVFEFRSLPSGDYEVRARLKDAGDQTRAVTRESVRVIAAGAGS